MLSRKDADDLHRRLKGLISETDRAIISEETDKEHDVWRLDVKHGHYVVNIYHPFQQRWIQISLSFQFNLSEAQKTILEEIYKNPTNRFEFDHGLRSSLTTPTTFYSINYDKTDNNIDIPSGFAAGIKLFPLDDSFSIQRLENSIQNVVSAGSLGHNFLASVLRVGEMSIKQQEAFASSPEGMYL